jgi:hypothetical protein
MDKLEAMHNHSGGKPLGLNALMKEVKKLCFANVQAKGSNTNHLLLESSLFHMPTEDLLPELQAPPSAIACTPVLSNSSLNDMSHASDPPSTSSYPINGFFSGPIPPFSSILHFSALNYSPTSYPTYSTT